MMTNHTSFCQRYSDSKKHPLKMHVQHTLTASNTPPHYLSLLLPHFWGLIWSLFPPSHTPPANSHLDPTKNIIFFCVGTEFINMWCSLGPDISASNKPPLGSFNSVMASFLSTYYSDLAFRAHLALYSKFVCLSGSAGTLHKCYEFDTWQEYFFSTLTLVSGINILLIPWWT